MVFASLSGAMFSRRPPRQELKPPVRTMAFFPERREVEPLVIPTPQRKGEELRPLKNRISIGGPTPQREQGPLVLRREEDFSGPPGGRPENPAPLPNAAAVSGSEAPSSGPAPGAEILRGPDPQPSRERGPSISSSLRSWARRLGQDSGPWGVEGGVGRQMGPLFFDPEGADFTAWINHFKNEVYRNWVVPQAALFGFRGQVNFQFTVERDGRLTNLRVLHPSGTVALDRAAQNALLGSRLLPLPQDFAPPRVTMQVTFFYNQDPQGS